MNLFCGKSRQRLTTDITSADAARVAAVLKAGIHPQPRADHHRPGPAALRQHRHQDLADEPVAGRVVRIGIAELRRQAHGHVDRLHLVEPVREEAPHLVHGPAREVRPSLVPPRPQLPAGARPVAEERVDPQHGREARILADARNLLPQPAFLVVEDRVGHGDEVHVRDLHHLVDVLVRVLLGEPLAVWLERLLIGVQSQPFQGREDAPAGLADRRPLDEQVLPDVVGLLLLAHGPEFVVGQCAWRARRGIPRR